MTRQVLVDVTNMKAHCLADLVRQSTPWASEALAELVRRAELSPVAPRHEIVTQSQPAEPDTLNIQAIRASALHYAQEADATDLKDSDLWALRQGLSDDLYKLARAAEMAIHRRQQLTAALTPQPAPEQALTLKTDLRSPEQLDTIPAELLAALGKLGPGQAVLTLDGNEATWAAERLGLSGSRVTVERVLVCVRVGGEG